MSAPRFHVEVPLAGIASGQTFELPERVAHHALRVLRLGDGQPIVLFDGAGGEYRATLLRADRRAALARIDGHDPVEREWARPVTLVLAALASDAMDVAVRKAVELGAARIVTMTTARTQRLGDDVRSRRRHAHWQSVAVAACEQCGRNRVPDVVPPVPLAQAIDAAARDGAVAMAVPAAAESLASFASRAAPRSVVIGPEGGWTDAELAYATQAGATPVHLGRRVLRAETAAVAAFAMLAATIGDAR